MTPEVFLSTILDPGLLWCSRLPGWYIISDDRVRVGLTAISGQEANWTARKQQPIDYAHGLFQFERGGGVHGVLTHPQTAALANRLCTAAKVSDSAWYVWKALADPAYDPLAVGFARLLLYTDKHPLPAMDDEDGWYAYYLGLWRPGAPSRKRWEDVFPKALAAVEANHKGQTP